MSRLLKFSEKQNDFAQKLEDKYGKGNVNLDTGEFVPIQEQLETDYNKKVFESSFYTIQIFYGDLKEADSILKVFTDEFEEIETSLIFETPNYKARVGIFKNFIDAAKNLEKIKRKFRGAFILKNDEL